MRITKDNMLTSLEDKSVAWMEFSNFNSKKYPNHLHCFFEGEDRKYYEDRIIQYTKYSPESFIGYDCKGKKNVIKLFQKIIRNPKYKEINNVFFIDKDYGLDSITKCEKLYITPGYSIENFYVNKTTISRIFNTEFGMNYIEEDYTRAIIDFESRLNEFRRATSIINAFFMSTMKMDVGVDMSKFRIEEMIDIRIDEISSNIYNWNSESIFNFYMEALHKDLRKPKKAVYAQADIQKYTMKKQEILQEIEMTHSIILKNLELYSHGKIELIFMKKFLEELKKNSATYFIKKRAGIKIDINSQNILSNFARYASTPSCLVDFLSKYNYASVQAIS